MNFLQPSVFFKKWLKNYAYRKLIVFIEYVPQSFLLACLAVAGNYGWYQLDDYKSFKCWASKEKPHSDIFFKMWIYVRIIYSLAHIVRHILKLKEKDIKIFV